MTEIGRIGIACELAIATSNTYALIAKRIQCIMMLNVANHRHGWIVDNAKHASYINSLWPFELQYKKRANERHVFYSLFIRSAGPRSSRHQNV